MKYNFKIMKKSTLAIMLMASASIFGQNTENLIDNGSFESTDGKAKKLGAIQSAKGWVSPTGQAADLYLPTTKVPAINTAGSTYGKEDAKDGSNYAGFTGFSLGGKVPRSYVTTKLSTPMKKGIKYCVTYYVSLSEASMYGCNQIGAQFTKKDRAVDGKISIIEKPSVLHFSNKVFTGMYGWEKICGVYTAEGGEKFITIGNFEADANTKNEKIKKTKENKFKPLPMAYYFLDDISVKAVENYSDCDCAVVEEEEAGSNTIYHKTFHITDKMTAKEKIETYKTFFGFGKDVLTDVSKQHLDEVVALLKANPSFKIQVMGHSDSLEVAMSEEKPKLADMDNKRINAVMAYLLEKGIPENRMIPSAQGVSVPSEEIAEGDEDDVKLAKTRRVTFKVRD